MTTKSSRLFSSLRAGTSAQHKGHQGAQKFTNTHLPRKSDRQMDLPLMSVNWN